MKLAYLGVLGLSLSLISCKSESTPEAGEKKSKQTTSAADESESLAALQFAKESAGAGEEEADNFPDDATTIDHSIKDRAKALRAEYDINKDGKLDDSERAALRASMEQSVLKKFDKNGDGKIDAEEDLAIRNEIHQNMKSCKAGHDKRRSMGGQGPGKRDPKEICKHLLGRAALDSPEQIKQKPMLTRLLEKCKTTGYAE